MKNHLLIVAFSLFVGVIVASIPLCYAYAHQTHQASQTLSAPQQSLAAPITNYSDLPVASPEVIRSVICLTTMAAWSNGVRSGLAATGYWNTHAPTAESVDEIMSNAWRSSGMEQSIKEFNK